MSTKTFLLIKETGIKDNLELAFFYGCEPFFTK